MVGGGIAFRRLWCIYILYLPFLSICKFIYEDLVDCQIYMTIKKIPYIYNDMQNMNACQNVLLHRFTMHVNVTIHVANITGM